MSEMFFTKRMDRLRQTLAKQGLDGIYLTNLTNIRYMTGFTGSSAAALVTPAGQYFISDGRYLEMSRQQVKGFERFISHLTHLEIIKANELIPAGLKLAFEGDFMSVNQYQQLQTLFPAVAWTATSRIIEELAAVKDTLELSALRTAVEITDRVYAEVLPLIHAGVTEKTIANELATRYRLYGDGEAYDSIVAGGPNSALPHAVPSDRPFRNGDFIVIDAAARYAGYHADMTRTPVVGKPTGKHEEIYAIVKDAQQAGCDAIKAGISCREIDAVTRDIITARGYGEHYIHSTGHGLGLEIHTMPRLSQTSVDSLKENYVVTMEPGIYLAGWGGVRIEDDIIVGKDGGEILNQTTKDLVIL